MHWPKKIEAYAWIAAWCWIVRFVFIVTDIYFAPFSWSRQWMDTAFVFIIRSSEGIGILTAIIGLFLLAIRLEKADGGSDAIL